MSFRLAAEYGKARQDIRVSAPPHCRQGLREPFLASLEDELSLLSAAGVPGLMTIILGR